MSKTLVVVGSQWGDEGKGKITDCFATRANMAVRYQGGNNAGHSVVFDGHKYSLQSIPSGIFNPNTVNVMGNGMVVNPVSVVAELKRLNEQGIRDYQLYISDRAAMVMPWHPVLDGAYEAGKGNAKIGTTKKGIGPAYADKYSRIGLRMGDLLEPEYFRMRLEAALEVKNKELQMLGLDTFKADEVYEQYMELAKELGPRICDTSDLINKALLTDAHILFEGAQGQMLDIDTAHIRLSPVRRPQRHPCPQAPASPRNGFRRWWAWQRLTAHAWEKGPSPPNCTTPSATASANADMNMAL